MSGARSMVPAQVALPLLRLEDVSRLLNIHLRTIKEWRASGRLRVLVFGRHCVRVEPGELERLKREARA